MAASIGRLDNAGRIAGGDNGILARGAVNTLNNSGTIRGGRGAALKARPNNGRRAAIPRGAAASEGIRLSSTAPAGPVTLENTGTIEGGTIRGGLWPKRHPPRGKQRPHRGRHGRGPHGRADYPARQQGGRHD